MSFCKKDKTCLRINLWIQAGSKSSCLVGVYEDCLKIKIAAPAIEGKANQEICNFLSKQLGLSKSQVKLLKGEKSKRKLVELKSTDLEALEEKLHKWVNE